MNEISCEICRDLIPLVADGVAADDSVRAVKDHIETCADCRAAYAEEAQTAPPKANPTLAFAGFQRKMRVFFAMLLMFGVVLGLSLTANSGLFYNILLMPAIGALGYGLFRRKSLYILPILLYGTHFLTNLLPLGGETLDLWSLIWWTSYYVLFALLGVVIAWLLHFALKKER